MTLTASCGKTLDEPKYVAYVIQDDGWWGQPPQDQWDTMYELIHFDSGHHNYGDPDRILACVQEDEDGHSCELMPWEHDDHSVFKHSFVGDISIAFTLQGGHYQNTRFHVDRPWNAGYDFEENEIKGVLRVKDQFFEEYSEASDEQRLSIAEGEVEAYNQWANGDIWIVRIVERRECIEPCSCCGDDKAVETDLDDGPLGGIFGSEGVQDYIEEVLGKDAECEVIHQYAR